jgi:hypothetical protein
MIKVILTIRTLSFILSFSLFLIKVLAQEEMKVRLQLESELSVLRGKLDSETRKAVEIQRMRMIDQHRRRSEDLTSELLKRHEIKLRQERDTMTKLHQSEQEVVMKELSEALAFGTRTALEEHATALRRITNEKILIVKNEKEKEKNEALKKLKIQLQNESELAIRRLRESSLAELDVLQSRLRGEAAADHAAKVNRLQIDNASKRSLKENEFKLKYDEEYIKKSNLMNIQLNNDINETLEKNEIIYNNKLKNNLNTLRKDGERRQQAMLITMERNFQKELKEMKNAINNFFDGGGSSNASGSSDDSLKSSHMPTTKRAIQQRLAIMTEQFDTYKSKYKRAAKDLGSLQNEIIDLRQKLKTTIRALESSEKRNSYEERKGGSKSKSIRGNGSELDQSVHDLYSANQRLIERVTRSSR